MSRLVPFALAGLLASCGPLRFNLHLHDSGPSLAVTGSPVLLRVFVTTPGGDERSPALPAKPLCAVTAPSGAAVECAFSDWTLPSVHEDNGTATLSFIPPEPGWYDASATLTDGEQVSWHFFVVVHFQGEVLTQLERGCSWVERLAADAWLCDDVVLRAGAQPQFLGGELAAVGGHTVWVWNAGELRRFRDSGAGPLTPEPAPRFDTRIFSAQVLFATESEALLVHPDGLTRVEVNSSGALQLGQSFDHAFAPGFVVTRSGEVVMTAERAGDEVDVCTWLLSGALTAGPCRRYPGLALGRGEGGLLLQAGTQLRRVGPALDDGVEAELPVPLRGPIQLAGRGLVVLWAGVIPRVLGTTLLFESYSGVSGADESFVWGSSRTGTTVTSR